MKRVIAVIVTVMAVSLTGCMGNVVDVTVVVKNSTEYELKWVSTCHRSQAHTAP